MDKAQQPTDFIDIYCERVGAGFWDEPLNAVTNLSFILAAFFAFRFYKSTGNKKPDILLLILIAAAVGIGSFSFHTLATETAMMADVIPIGLFMFLALGIFLARTAKYKEMGVTTGILLFAGLNYIAQEHVPHTYLNGSEMYLPALLAMYILGWWCSNTKVKGAREFFAATMIFSVAIAARSLDLKLCIASNQIGTHFVWHILNGFVLYLVIKGLIRSADNK